FDLPEKDEGVVQAFRRGESNYRTAELQLRGFEADGVYAVTDLDSGGTQTLTGRILSEVGLRVEIASRPGSAVLVYKKLRREP
ncbi:MAG: hypothetical protein ACUVXJ_16235, partial [Phycisphaerae bacterium]